MAMAASDALWHGVKRAGRAGDCLPRVGPRVPESVVFVPAHFGVTSRETYCDMVGRFGPPSR